MDRKLNLPAGIEAEISSLRETFEIFDNPKDKFVQLMDMAKNACPLIKNFMDKLNLRCPFLKIILDKNFYKFLIN